jgi:hypothetical protein
MSTAQVAHGVPVVVLPSWRSAAAPALAMRCEKRVGSGPTGVVETAGPEKLLGGPSGVGFSIVALLKFGATSPGSCTPLIAPSPPRAAPSPDNNSSLEARQRRPRAAAANRDSRLIEHTRAIIGESALDLRVGVHHEGGALRGVLDT